VKNSTVVKTTTHKDPMRSDCTEGEMHQKLFGGRALPRPTGELTVPPDSPLNLWEGGAMGKGK